MEKVRQRLLRATAALKSAGIDYAVVGGNAVAAWVATVDEAAVRNTQDVDILIRRADFDRVRHALEDAGFVYRRAAALDMFLDDAGGKARDAVHLIFAHEVVKADQPDPNPDVTASQEFEAFRVISLDALVRLKLSSFRRKDQVHLLDMIGVGLVDQSWMRTLPPVLAERLQHLFDTPDE